MKSFELFIPGRPYPKGSMKAVPSKSTGHIIMIPSSKHTKTWQRKMEKALTAYWPHSIIPIGTRVIISATFFFHRPKNHWMTSRGQAIPFLRTKAPGDPYGSKTIGDEDKLMRCVFDALTGIVYDDDCQGSIGIAEKAYAPLNGEEGVDLLVEWEGE